MAGKGTNASLPLSQIEGGGSPVIDPGFFTLSRRMFSSSSWLMGLRDPEAVLFAVFLLARANWRPGTVMVNGKPRVIERGQTWASYETLAQEFWSLRHRRPSVRRIRTFLGVLELNNFLTRETTSAGQVITICNYARYQDITEKSSDERHADRQAERQATDNNRTIEPEEKSWRHAKANPYDRASDWLPTPGRVANGA